MPVIYGFRIVVPGSHSNPPFWHRPLSRRCPSFPKSHGLFHCGEIAVRDQDLDRRRCRSTGRGGTPRQLGIALHRDFDVDEQPPVRASQQARLYQFVGRQWSEFKVGYDFAEFLLQRDGVDRSIDAPGALRDGEI